jgi:hypothetical protein
MEVNLSPDATNSCPTGSTFAPTPGATSVSISGATVPVNTTCTFTVKVKATTAGELVNTTGTVSSSNGGTGLMASATLTVGEFFEADVSARPNGDSFVDADDIQQIRRFAVGLDLPYQSNEFQRADNAPRNTFGDSFVDADDIEQARRYAVGLDSRQDAGGPTSPPVNAAEWSERTILSTGKLAPVAGRAVRLINQTSSAGQQVTVPINVDTTGDETGYTFSISFNPAVLQADSVTIGDLGGNVISNINNTNGTIGFSITSFSGANGTITEVTNQTLVRVQFTVAVNASTGATQINFTDTPARRKVSGVDPNSPLPQPAYENGTVTVSGPTSAKVFVSGRVMKGNNSSDKGVGVARATVTFTDLQGNLRTARTNQFGYYRFEEVDVGLTYVFQASAKGMQFAPQVVTVNEEIENLNFFASP